MSRDIRIEGSRKGYVKAIVFAVFFGALSVLVLAEPDMWLLGVAGLVVSVVGLVVTLLSLRPGATHLRLHSSGFDFVAAGRTHRYFWTDVDGFRLVKVFGAECVAMQFKSSCESQRIARAIAKRLTGIEGVIPNMYESSPAQICDLLNARMSVHDQAMIKPPPLA